MKGMHKCEGSFLRKGMLLGLCLLLMMVIFMPAGPVQAADSKWINQVWSNYKAYNKKTVAAYNNYMDQQTQTYNTYLKTQNDRLAELERIVLEDQNKWNEKLEADLADLQKRYGDNRDLRSELNEYARNINPNSLSSPMGIYTREANRNSLSSTMGTFARAINENSLSSYMGDYKRAISPNLLSSPAYALNKTVSDSYISSPMYALMKNSSTSYITSPIYAYSRGKISKTKAQQQISKLYKELTAKIAKDIARYKQQIANTASSSENKIQDLYLKTVRALEAQRNASLQNISDQRKKICGEGLTWEPLLKGLAGDGKVGGLK
ncbi:hypothetical protein [Paenibacillus tuaregi]|uniref:hypothetical protein n=1 Tax=Paenibacillus tuaregi TaxID=1816681 RepID=UPI0009ED2AFE|nr:hypothetical protein [Paenibacillus tuaregi]